MIDIDPKDIEVQAAFLIGNFLSHWSLLEAQINRALGEALGLSDLQRLIVTRNMQFRDKINALKACMSLMGGFDPATKITDACNQAAELANTSRNIVAHEIFWPTEDGAVEFGRIQAKGELKFPSVKWTLADFEAKNQKMLDLRDIIKTNMPTINLLEAVRKSQQKPPPSQGLFGLNYLSLLSLLPQSTPGFRTASQQTSEQTPSPEKE